MSFARHFLIFSVISSPLILGACSTGDSSSPSSSRVGPTYQGPAETPNCATSIAYSGSTTTVSGTALFTRRETYDHPAAAPTYEGLGSASTAHPTLPAKNHPIRAAEIRVTDSGGGVVQCAQTSATDGTFSFVLPKGNTVYTVSINSRSFQFNGGNTYMNVSVLNKPETNQHYSLTTTVNAGGADITGLTLVADALSSGQLLGGAFNIMDQIFAANDFLRAKLNPSGIACSTTYPGCTDVGLTQAIPKVVAYWTKGFNPNDYFGSSSGLSFYLPGYSRLFILGGVDGDVDVKDTDHFDNSVIIHEYGHFLEDVMFRSDSPGGSHNGNKIIDPRLAWSEGWGNFIQAAVQVYSTSVSNANDATMLSTKPRYYDTIGNLDGGGDFAFAVDLENETSGHDVIQTTSPLGEGNFREFAVTRFLYDVVDAASSETPAGYTAFTDSVSNQFNEIWASLTKTSGGGFRQSTVAFRNVGTLHLAQQQLSGHGDWTSIQNGNFHVPDNSEYARYVVPNAGACSTAVTAPSGNILGVSAGTPTGYEFKIDPTYSASNLSASNLFVDNNFYHINVAAGTYTITLRYKEAVGTQKADLDLYVYNEDYVFGSSTGMMVRNIEDPTTGVGAQQDVVTTVTLPAGNYMINVNAYTGGTFVAAGETHYSVLLNGVKLCPASL